MRSVLNLSLAALLLLGRQVADAGGSIGSNEVKEVQISSYLVKPTGDAQMRAIAARFEVTHRHGDAFEVYVPSKRAVELLALAPQAIMHEADISATFKYLEKEQPEFLASYRSWAQVQQWGKDLAAAHPGFVQLVPYGQTSSGKPLFALKISDNVAENETEPELMITSATHGDEIITTEVLLHLVDELVAGYGSNQRLTDMVDNHELYFIPAVNADGFAARSRYAGSVDPNRDYPWPDNPSKRSTACIEAIIKFFGERDIVGSLDLHAYGRLVMYPWAYTYDQVESSDQLAFKNLGGEMAEHNGYRVGSISNILYTAQGSSADYYYWKKGTLAYGIELTTTKAPPGSQIPTVVNEAREMVWRFIEHW